MAIWVEEISLDRIKERSKNTMAEHLDIQFTEIQDDALVATMPVDHKTQQPLGLLNGGASLALAETIASTAANFCVNQKEAYCIGLDINGNHLRGATKGRVKAIAKPHHLGKRTQVWEVNIYDEDDRHVCVARMTAIVMRR